MDMFHAAGWEFTLRGYIVLSVGVSKYVDRDGGHGAEMLGPDVVKRLDTLHLRKIDISDLVFVLNVGGYIGESTAAEVRYAAANKKRIAFLEELDPKERDHLMDCGATIVYAPLGTAMDSACQIAAKYPQPIAPSTSLLMET